jgi:hypothetical protein
MKIDGAVEFVPIDVTLCKVSSPKGWMKRLLLPILLTTAIFIVVGFLSGRQLRAKPLNNKNRQAAVMADSFTGTMKNLNTGQLSDISKGTATQVSITFDLSKDKTSVTQISISVGEIKYEIKTPDRINTGSRAGAKVFLNGPFPISSKIFQTRDGKDTIFAKGAFVSPQKAQGSAHLYTSVTVEGTRFDVDLGEWQWKATGH